MNIAAKNVIPADDIIVSAYICFTYMAKKTLYLLILLPGMWLLACQPRLAPEPQRLGYDYFPLAVGQYRIYQVEAVYYRLGGNIDTVSYQLKEEVTGRTVVGRDTVFTLLRSLRTTTADSWQPDSVWTARVNPYQAVVVENNRPLIKLSFPVADNRKWDGNALNGLDYDEFYWRNVGQEYDLDGQLYTSSAEMVKEDLIDPNQITADHYHVEIFSKGVGLIHRIDLDKKYCSPVDCSQPGIILEGQVVEQKLLEFGTAD